MNINQSTLNFQAKTINVDPVKRIISFEVPGKNKTRILTNITEIKNKYTNLEYQVLKKNNEIEKKVYHNKRGFDYYRLESICNNIQNKVREGVDFLEELIEAQWLAIKKGNKKTL